MDLPESGAADDRLRVWILGLMRSGTTIFWRAWRKDSRLLCYDEPFSGLSRLPEHDENGSRAEFVRLFRRAPDPWVFWDRYAPLHPVHELDSFFTSDQAKYLRYLLTQSERIVFDETRLHLHLPHLAELTPDAYVIHLHRRARGFVTSHLCPSWYSETTWWRQVVRWLRREYQKRVFWTRDGYPPGLRRDDVIGRHAESKFGLMLDEAGYDAEEIMASSALVRLLAYWS